MATRYRIYAYSPTQNQKQQLMDIIGDSMLSDPNYANQHAQAFAQRLNSTAFLHTRDWQPSTEAYEYADNPQPVDQNGDNIIAPTYSSIQAPQ
jgi:hypothetical protein